MSWPKKNCILYRLARGMQMIHTIQNEMTIKTSIPSDDPKDAIKNFLLIHRTLWSTGPVGGELLQTLPAVEGEYVQIKTITISRTPISLCVCNNNLANPSRAIQSAGLIS